MNHLGWIANAFLVAGSLSLGGKHAFGFLLIVAGELMWAWKAHRTRQRDLAVICVVFALLAARNFAAWSSE